MISNDVGLIKFCTKENWILTNNLASFGKPKFNHIYRINKGGMYKRINCSLSILMNYTDKILFLLKVYS